MTLLVPLLGLGVLYSAGYDPSASMLQLGPLPFALPATACVKQGIFLGLAIGVMVITLLIPTSSLQRYSYLFYGIGVVLLIAVLLFGNISHGSRRWFALGGVNLQPAEPMKIALILGLANFLSKNPPSPGGYMWHQLILPFLIILVPTGLIIRQPDLGTSLSVAVTGFVMVLFMGIRWRSLATMAGLALVAAVPAWGMLYPYQKRRILALFNPDADPLGSGYHIIQSKIAVGSGAVFGKGFLRGTQTQLEFLPEHTTDFVFSVLAEEWGFVGSIFVLLCYLVLIALILRVVLKSKNLFCSLAAFGIGTLIFFHTVVNIGMVVGLLPVVGLTLPLFSYGGSSLLTFSIAMGIVLGISMRRFIFVGRD